jgi:acetyl-CoA carboxylase biotin carboxyl carrier protein
MEETMNIENIRQLAHILNEAGLTGIEVSEANIKIRLEKNTYAPIAIPLSAGAPGHTEPAPQPETKPAPADSGQVVDFNKLKEVKSPMVGLYYHAPAPGSPPYVAKGSKVKKGDVLCIIEAMKMMNEIAAEVDGEIVDICAQDGQLVEFSQVLFKLF